MAVRKKKKQQVKPNGGLHKGSLELALDLFSKGLSNKEVRKQVSDYRKERGLTVTEKYIYKIVGVASKQLASEYGKDKNEVIALHIQRYNKDILNLIEFDPEKTDMDPRFHKRALIDALYGALSSMLNKEKVLQMHSKGFQVFINNVVNVKEEEEKPEYDISGLTGAEKLDFLKLVMKAKKTDGEIASIIYRNKEDNQVTIDIPHEVVKEEVNIDKIKRIEPPKKEVVKLPPNDALMSAHEKLAYALQQKAIEEFKKAGSTTVQQDERELQQLHQAKNNSK